MRTNMKRGSVPIRCYGVQCYVCVVPMSKKMAKYSIIYKLYLSCVLCSTRGRLGWWAPKEGLSSDSFATESPTRPCHLDRCSERSAWMDTNFLQKELSRRHVATSLHPWIFPHGLLLGKNIFHSVEPQSILRVSQDTCDIRSGIPSFLIWLRWVHVDDEAGRDGGSCRRKVSLEFY